MDSLIVEGLKFIYEKDFNLRLFLKKGKYKCWYREFIVFWGVEKFLGKSSSRGFFFKGDFGVGLGRRIEIWINGK